MLKVVDESSLDVIDPYVYNCIVPRVRLKLPTDLILLFRARTNADRHRAIKKGDSLRCSSSVGNKSNSINRMSVFAAATL